MAIDPMFLLRIFLSANRYHGLNFQGWEKPEGRIALNTTGDSSNQQLNNSVYKRLGNKQP